MNQTSPDIERKRNPAAALCVILAVLCVAMAGAAWYFWHNAAAANERAEQAEAKAEEMADCCDALIKAGERTVDRADELFDTSDELLHEAQKNAGYRFSYGGSRAEFDSYLESTWNYTVDYVRERMP